MAIDNDAGRAAPRRRACALPVLLLHLALSLVVFGSARGIGAPRTPRSPKTLVPHVRVFGIPVYAPRDVSTCPELSGAKVDHVASVLAEWLDSDLDGTVDNGKVAKSLAKKACMVVVCDDGDIDDDLIREVDRDCGGAAVVWGDEIRPRGSSASHGFDATLEEVLHLVTQFGYSVVYKKALGERSTSRLGRAMTDARGGVVGNGRPTYPASAWYTYDDPTCDGECMVTEYFYWGLTSVLGGQSYPGRYDDIRGEWRLNTKAKVKARDPALYKLMVGSKKMKMPKRLPDGHFARQAAAKAASLPEAFPNVFSKDSK